MSRFQQLRQSPAVLILLILAVATVLKWTWALFSAGTSDAILFFKFAQSIDQHSLAYLYKRTDLFNHTPFTGFMSVVLLKAAGGEYASFTWLLRVVCILADVAVVIGLLRIREKLALPWWALALFAASPVSLMVSGFHGNVDPLMVMFLFFAAVAVLHGRAVWSGLLLGAACNIKVVPLLVVPVFFFYWCHRDRRSVIQFTAGFALVMLVGMIKPLLECPAEFAKNVLGYGSVWGAWGITYGLRLTGVESFQTVSFHDLSPAQLQVMSVLKMTIICAVLALSWQRRKVEPTAFFGSLAAAFTLFFIFTPGVGVQYMVWFAPFLLLLSPPWWVAITAGSSCFLFAFYHSTSRFHFPWDLAFPVGTEVPYWAPWTILPWLTFIALLASQWRNWFAMPIAAKVNATSTEVLPAEGLANT